jgi:hypothetical protein
VNPRPLGGDKAAFAGVVNPRPGSPFATSEEVEAAAAKLAVAGLLVSSPRDDKAAFAGRGLHGRLVRHALFPTRDIFL